MKNFFKLCAALLFLAVTSFNTWASDNEANIKSSLGSEDRGRIYYSTASKKTTFRDMYQHHIEYTDTVYGDLSFPARMSASDKVPAMVLMHSSGGVNSTMYEWADFFNKLGIATFVVNSFDPRGFKRLAEDFSRLQAAASTVDSLRALQLLSTHPKIDASRIGVIGFSRGAEAAILSGFENLRPAVISDGQQFALHLMFYAGCNRFGKTTGKPMLMLLGTEDDYFPVEKCQSNVDALKSLGAKINLIVYPGALHAFDVSHNEVWVSGAQNWRKCAPSITNLDTGLTYYTKEPTKPVEWSEHEKYMDSCRTTGIRAGTDRKAREKSHEEVKNFVVSNFHLN